LFPLLKGWFLFDIECVCGCLDVRGARVECLLASLAPQIAPLGALVKGNESRIKSESREEQDTWRVWTRRVMLRREQKMKKHGNDKLTDKRKLRRSKTDLPKYSESHFDVVNLNRVLIFTSEKGTY